MEIRFARENELERVNVLRKQVNDLHVEGKPDVFKPGFNDDLRDHISNIWNDPEQEIVVADVDGIICGFAVVHHIYKAENPFMYERDFIDVDEFCVDESFRRQGVATEIIAFILLLLIRRLPVTKRLFVNVIQIRMQFYQILIILIMMISTTKEENQI